MQAQELDILVVLLLFIDFRCILPKRPHRKCRLEERRGRKPYKNNTFGCNVEQKAYKINTFEDYQIKKQNIGFSNEHVSWVFIDPDTVLLICCIIFSRGRKSFAHRTLLIFYQKGLPKNVNFSYRKAFAHRTVLCAD